VLMLVVLGLHKLELFDISRSCGFFHRVIRRFGVKTSSWF
jgi:hypothetical protein